MSLRDHLRNWLPPALLRWRRRRNRNLIRFTGNYPDFATARAASTGYDAELIRNRVIEAQRAVRAGRGLYAQDGVVIESAPPPLRLLSVLYHIAIERGDNRVSIIDFGGALGSTYNRCRHAAPPNLHIDWNVIEQPALVEAGRKEFESDELHFATTIEDRLSRGPVDLLLLSGVLPYLEDPFTLLQQITTTVIPWLVIDRTPLLHAHNRLTVQHVPASIYGSPQSYPAWFLDHEQICNVMNGAYELLAEHPSGDGEFDLGNVISLSCGMIWKRRHSESV